MRIRFFAGYDLDAEMLSTTDGMAHAYAGGVPMGSDLVAKEHRRAFFMVWAARDAMSAPLQRLQIIKGWVAEGETHERVYDVGCSDGLAVDSVTHRCPDNDAKVNLSDCAISADRGAARTEGAVAGPRIRPYAEGLLLREGSGKSNLSMVHLGRHCLVFHPRGKLIQEGHVMIQERR